MRSKLKGHTRPAGHLVSASDRLALGTAGCGFRGQPDPADRPVPSDRVVAFARSSVRMRRLSRRRRQDGAGAAVE